ncbi:MAG: PilC/PilY family type IV pilus protein [Spongiibacteraceae bacterium]|jgi:type IV pilus assembly protein PilY1|nr:PilC/PilY family type IV pilus protein [Spongiibacteraceae bacterium]
MQRLISAPSLRFACAIAAAGMFSLAEAQVAQAPLSLTEGVPPNMIFTLDDSGSMRWAFAPDEQSSAHATRRAKSSAFNPMYFDPTVTYVAPKIINSSGNEEQLSTSFTAAYHNGFDTGRSSTDLSSNYKVTWTYNLTDSFPTSYGYSSTNPRLAENPEGDFSCTVSGLNRSGRSGTCTLPGGHVVTIERNNNDRCTATISGWGNGACSQVSGSTFRADWKQRGVPAYYYTYNDNNSDSCTLTDESCYFLKFVTADQQQNFANWYSFYRNRALATMSAASLAFFDLSPAVRLTWQGLGNCNKLDGGPNNCKDNKFREFDANHKAQFYAWLRSVNFNQSTYLPAAMKRAGEFLKSSTAWHKYPNSSVAGANTADNTYACRPSYHIAMTDGLWNSTTSDPSNYRQDQNSFTLPDDVEYSGQHPYHDSTTKTLADLAMHYWATDLNSNLENKVPAFTPYKGASDAETYWDPRNNPATWQHMVNFMMGLGLTAALNDTDVPWAGGTFEGAGYAALKAGTADWPAAGSGKSENVYDLWHAAINSRGEFFSVDNPDAMVQAFKSILNRISERTGTAASPAINSGVLEEEGDSLVSYAYHSYYYSDESWAGDLKGYEKTRSLNAATGQWEIVTSELWSARAQLASKNWQSRNIQMARPDGSALQPLTWANAGDADTAGTLAHYLRTDPDRVESPCDTAACAEKRLNFLRGDRSEEGDLLRERRSVLGDFVASRPASVRGARYLVGYANRIEGADSGYQAYYEAQEQRAKNKPRIYVGANDGMLHAFDARTGAETFAYVPTAVFPNLHRLTGKTYGHHFYVDGSPVVADVYIEHQGSKQWRTVLIGTLRAGGKGLFALDITDPDNIALLWEFEDSDIPAEDGDDNRVRLGYSFPQPTVARLHNGRWAVVTGNGYASDGHTHGRAALLIIDVATGQLTKSIEVQGTPSLANGLSSPRLVDIIVDGVADYAYAGDLQGNLWRFNLTPHRPNHTGNPFDRQQSETDSAEAHFKVSYGGKPLFSAVASDGSRQPITAPPAVIRHPSRVGHLVIVGTGKYFEVNDKSGASAKQTIYGIWDTNTRSTSGNESGPGSVTTGTLTRAKLQAQTYDAALGVTGSIRTLSQHPVKWAVPPQSAGGQWNDNDGHKYGWYFDLSLSGEMTIENMLFVGQTLFFQTLVPNDDPCENGAENWTHAVNPYTGGRTRHHAFRDIRLSGNLASTPVTAVNHPGEGGLTLGLDPLGTYMVCTGEQCLNVNPDPESLGRQSWRRVEE